MICDLFVDIGKFKGGNTKAKIGQLLDLLENYKDVATLIEFFEQP